MKNLIIILAFLTIGSGFISCDKEDVEDAAASISNASMTASVNDTSWTSITRVSKFFTTTNIFVLTGTSTDGKILAVTIKGAEIGTYTSSTSIDSLSAQVGAAWRANGKNYVSKEGRVEITKLDKTNKKISGTFSFKILNANDLAEQISVTSGKFDNLSYTQSTDDNSNK